MKTVKTSPSKVINSPEASPKPIPSVKSQKLQILLLDIVKRAESFSLNLSLFLYIILFKRARSEELVKQILTILLTRVPWQACFRQKEIFR